MYITSVGKVSLNQYPKLFVNKIMTMYSDSWMDEHPPLFHKNGNISLKILSHRTCASIIYNSINDSMNQKDDIESLLCHQIMEWFITYIFDTVYIYKTTIIFFKVITAFSSFPNLICLYYYLFNVLIIHSFSGICTNNSSFCILMLLRIPVHIAQAKIMDL